MSIERFFRDHTCTITRTTRVKTPGGGQKETQVLVAADIPCAMRPRSRRERLVADREESRMVEILYISAGQDIRRDDIVTVSGVPGAWKVQNVDEPQYANVYYRVELEGFQRGS